MNVQATLTNAGIDPITMEIIAQGPKIVHKVNGVMFATVIDHDKEMSRKKGFIALQDHGKGCTVAFRNIRLKMLP